MPVSGYVLIKLQPWSVIFTGLQSMQILIEQSFKNFTMRGLLIRTNEA